MKGWIDCAIHRAFIKYGLSGLSLVKKSCDRLVLLCKWQWHTFFPLLASSELLGHCPKIWAYPLVEREGSGNERIEIRVLITRSVKNRTLIDQLSMWPGYTRRKHVPENVDNKVIHRRWHSLSSQVCNVFLFVVIFVFTLHRWYHQPLQIHISIATMSCARRIIISTWNSSPSQTNGYCVHGLPRFSTWHRGYVVLIEVSIPDVLFPQYLLIWR